MRVDPALRKRIMALALKWAKAHKKAFEYAAEMGDSDTRTTFRMQQLDNWSMNAEDRMYKLVSKLPLTAAEDEQLGPLVVVCCTGVIADNGYDRDSMFDWIEGIQEDFMDKLLVNGGTQ
jgi:hypothetical protein